MNHGNVAKEAKAMLFEADNTAKKLCDAMVAEHAKRAEYFPSGEVHQISAQGHRVGGAAPRGRLVPAPAAVMVHTRCHIAENGTRCVCDSSEEQQNGGAGSHSVAPAGNQIPMALPSPLSSQRTPWTPTTTGRRTSTPPSASSRTSPIPAHREDGFTGSDGRVLLHRGTRGNLQAALCRGTRPCGWTTSKPRKSGWMSKMCWFTWSWATEIEAITPYAYFCASTCCRFISLR